MCFQDLKMGFHQSIGKSDTLSKKKVMLKTMESSSELLHRFKDKVTIHEIKKMLLKL